VLLLAAIPALGQTLTIYDNALQNGFDGGVSYGGGIIFDSTSQAHSPTKSIAFTGNNYNAMGVYRSGPDVSTATYPVLRLWIHGGANGGQRCDCT